MKVFKITTLLIMILILGAVTVSAAHTFTDVSTSSKFNDAIDMLSQIGVIRGYNSTQFRPDDNVERWQMALMISKLVDGNVQTDYWYKTTNITSFTDVNVDHYLGSIEYAHKNGIVLGRSIEEGIFAPTDNITLQEGVTMVIRALKYPTNNLNAGYPESYINLGKELGLFAGLETVGYTTPMTRAETAQLLFNAAFTKTYFDVTYAESVFGIAQRTVVLTATNNYKLRSDVQFAMQGEYIFCEMNEWGALQTPFKLDAKLFTFNNVNDYLGMAYTITSNRDFSYILKIEAASTRNTYESTSPSTNLTVSANENKLTLNNNLYSIVTTSRSYRLEPNKVPNTKEVLVFGMNDIFSDSVKPINAWDMEGTTAYYKMITYDDNKDGFIDRILYMPYSVGQYKMDSSNRITITCPNGKIYVNRLNSQITSNNTSLKNEDYVIFSFNPQTNVLDIMKVLPASREGTVSSTTYSTANRQLAITVSGSSTTYTLGAMISGVDMTKFEKDITDIEANTLQNRRIDFIADGTVILSYKLFDNSPNITDKTTYTHSNFGIVTSVSNPSISYTVSTVYINSVACSVASIDGAQSGGEFPLSVGDLVEYTLVPNTTTYNITRKTQLPTYTTLQATSRISTVNSNNVLTFTVAEGTSYATTFSFPVSSTTVLYTYNSTNNTFTTKTISSYTETFTTNQRIYVAYSPTSSIPAAIYVRPVSITITGGSETDFDKIVYISSANIANSTTSGLSRLYPALDLESGYTIQVTLPSTMNNLTNAGFYRINATTNFITNNLPVTTNINNTNSLSIVRFVYSTTVTITSHPTIANTYTVTQGTQGSTNYLYSNIYLYRAENSLLGQSELVRQSQAELDNYIATGTQNKSVRLYVTPTKVILIALT